MASLPSDCQTPSPRMSWVGFGHETKDTTKKMVQNQEDSRVHMHIEERSSSIRGEETQPESLCASSITETGYGGTAKYVFIHKLL